MQVTRTKTDRPMSRAEEIQSHAREISKYQQEIEEMNGLVLELERQKEAVLVASAEALIAGEAFDLSIFQNLDDRLAQARRAVDILRRRYTANLGRYGPALTHNLPALRTTFQCSSKGAGAGGTQAAALRVQHIRERGKTHEIPANC